MNTSAARGLIKELAGGRADAPLTMEARRPLAGISCIAPDHCVAVGGYNKTGDRNDPLKSLVLREG